MEYIDNLLAINIDYIIIGLLIFFFSLEQLLPTPFTFKKRFSHLFQNSLFQIILTLLNLPFVIFQVYCIDWLNANQIGLLHLIEIPSWILLIASVVLYDFVTYWIHRATHRIPLLWRLHRVHHSDTTIDSSTTFRFHPIELLLVFGIGNIVTAAIFGTDIYSLALYYLVLYVFLFIEHTNLQHPEWINKTIGLIFVTPAHHRVHHHQEEHYTDSNYGDILILWDRLFGTFKKMPLEKIKYGLKEFDQEEKQTFLYLIKSPFIDIKKDTNKEH